MVRHAFLEACIAGTHLVKQCLSTRVNSWDPFHQWILFTIHIPTENMFCSNSISNHVITTIFCTGHDSIAVMACAKICRDNIAFICARADWYFHPTWTVHEKCLVICNPSFPISCWAPSSMNAWRPDIHLQNIPAKIKSRSTVIYVTRCGPPGTFFVIHLQVLWTTQFLSWKVCM